MRALKFGNTDWQGLATALLIGIVSGFVADHFGFPLPWILGPMIGNTFASVLRVRLAAPLKLRPFVIPVIGVLLGSGFRPEILERAGEWLVTFFTLPFFVLACSGLTFCFYRYVARYDPVTAFFSGMPGGLNEMLILGVDAGGQERRIALAHASRILVIVTFIVFFYNAVLGVSLASGGRPHVGFSEFSIGETGLLIVCALVGAVAAKRIGLPAPALLGPMILSALAYLGGWVEASPPTLLVIFAQLIIGTIIGCRFSSASPTEIGKDLLFGIGASAIMIAVAIGCAQAVSSITGADVRQSFLAFSPGGLTEMSLLAFAMGQDVVYVSVSHVVRIALVVFATPILFRTFRSRGLSAAQGEANDMDKQP